MSSADDQVGQDAAVPGEALGRQGGVLLRGKKRGRERSRKAKEVDLFTWGSERIEIHSRKLSATCLHGGEGGGGHRVVLPGQVMQRGRLLLLKGRRVSKGFDQTTTTVQTYGWICNDCMGPIQFTIQCCDNRKYTNLGTTCVA